MKLIKLYALIIIMLAAEGSFSQIVISNPGIQDSLSKISSLIWKQKSDSARLAISDVFFSEFHAALSLAGSPLIPFDSVNGITRVVSDDRKLRIFTWNVPLTDGSNRYYGFIQVLGDSSYIVPLKSPGKQTEASGTIQIAVQDWYGALYYKLIQQVINGRMTYTVLGWDGYTSVSNRKMIDIISFDTKGNLLLGLPVFKTQEGIKPRIVFEYAEQANLLLRYDYQAIRVEKRKKIKREDTWLIVMDRLVPADPSLKGIAKYYVPAGDVYDGFIFRNGYWVLVEDVEVANR